MESIFDAIRTEPIYGIFAIAAVLAVVLSLGRKLFKMALLICAALVVYMVYLHHAGRKVPTTAAEIKAELQDSVEAAKDKITDAFGGGEGDSELKKKVRDKAKKRRRD